MRIFLPILLLLGFPLLLKAQGSPPVDPEQMQSSKAAAQGTPPMPDDATPVQEVKKLVKKEMDHAIMSNTYPVVEQWHPLTARQKFHVFVQHTYSPSTFANAGLDAIYDKVQANDREFERGTMGLGQHYGIDLATNESDAFFERFLVPSLLRQDPRYFRNPELPFFRRVFYSMSRVLITRADSGGNTFNASKVLGGAASQALSDLYVPGKAQGLGPIRDRVTFDLATDAGMNLFREFWPDMRRKIFHR